MIRSSSSFITTSSRITSEFLNVSFSTLVIISGRTLSFIFSTLINSLVVAVFNLNFSTLYILSNSSFIIKSSRADSVKYFNSLSLVYTLYNFLGASNIISLDTGISS